MKKRNGGFTLVELIVVLSIFTLLLVIIVPSLNSILGFRVQRAVNSIGAALDKTKIEASSRLVGAMKLEYRPNDGYYISYILDRGKIEENGDDIIKTDQDEEKIAPAKTSISYFVGGQEKFLDNRNNEPNAIVITYDRATGKFLPLMKTQTKDWEEDLKVLREVAKQNGDNTYLLKMQLGEDQFCSKIVVKGGSRTRTITLMQDTGKYKITAGETS
nr:prepilin-type N-terminal cleavage/methylation domain-containing protein [uncultured Blautia sp.]